MVLKSLGAILLSVLLGGLVRSLIASLPFEIYQGGGGTGFFPSPKFDVVIIFIYGFFGAVYGFLTAVITLVLVRNGFPQLNILQILILTIAFGLIHSLVFAALQYYTSIEGTSSFALDDFARKLLLETAIIEFVTGCLIGLASVVVVKYFKEAVD